MNVVEWITSKIKGIRHENKIYLISNFEINKDHELYVKNAHKRLEEEDLNIDIIYGKKHRNEIRTAKYKIYSFIPLIVFFQFLRLGNLYFLSISMLQLIPEITDSKGMPTYLIPLVFIIVVAMIKEFFEDWQRHKSDNEENSKSTMVFENGILKEKKWANIKDGDVVKIFAYEYFPADLIVLNCSNKKGIVNIETKNVDGESNVKQKYCLPDISKYFKHDKSAGYCRIELISERPNDDIFDYKGYMLLPPLQYKADDGVVVHFYDSNSRLRALGKEVIQQHEKQQQQQQQQLLNGAKGKKHMCKSGKEASKDVDDTDNGNKTYMNNRFRSEINEQHFELSNVSNVSNVEVERKGRNEDCTTKYDEKISIFDYTNEQKEHRREKEKHVVHITIDNLVLRGTSLVNTKWIYGLVINTGNRTKLMKNASTKSRQKWSRLEFVYGNHVIVLIICQIFISFIVAIAGVLWMRKKGYNLWYLHLDQHSDSLKTFFITIGSMVLLFGSFIPVDLLLIWEVVRLLQGYLINWDNDMYSEKAGRHALSKAGQLLEEMGNVTHIYSDKTGTLTQNVMQLQNIGLGNKGIYGFYDFRDIKDNIMKKRRRMQSSDKFGSFIVAPEGKEEEKAAVDAEEDSQGDADDDKKDDHKGSENDQMGSENDQMGSENDQMGSENDQMGSENDQMGSENDKDKSEYFQGFQSNIPTKRNVNLRISSMNENYKKSKVHPLNWSRTSLNSHKKKKKHMHLNSLTDEHMTNIYSESDFERGENQFVFFNRILFVNKIYSIRNDAEDQVHFLLLVLSLCHSGMIRNVDIDEMDINEDENNSMDKIKIYDKETQINYTYITQTQPQYDTSSPDELALISTSLYLGCEFVNRPNLTTIEVELTSTFAQRFILGEKVFNDFLLKKRFYEDNFDTYFPEVSMSKDKKKRQSKLNESTLGSSINYNVKDEASNFYMSIPIKNIFTSNKVSFNEQTRMEAVEKERDEKMGEEKGERIEEQRDERVREEEKKKINKKVVPILSFEILDVFSFDNVRKRMSLIVKNEKDEIYMLVKGADTSVLKLAAKNQEHIVGHIEYQLNAFATSGLRTLVLGYKHLTEDEFSSMYRSHMEARKKSENGKGGITAGEDAGDEDYLQTFYDEAEKNLVIIGCTGIDDKLQEDVPQVIQDLRDAGMTICVLTGDKLETAINIGHSINILNKETYNAVFTETSPTLLLEQINIHEKNTNAANLLNVNHGNKWWNSVNWEHLNLDLRSETILNFMKTNIFGTINKSSISSNIFNIKNDTSSSLPGLDKQEKIYNSFLESSESFGHNNNNNNNDMDKMKGKDNKVHYSQFSITITGEALDVIMNNKILKIKFYTLARSASTLIACRVTPKQKSLLVKENSAFNPRGTSLAIGDGANDVGMILMANVGVGIAGKEGLQAARSSDFTISEFKYLKKLLFVHGRESLRRNSFLVYFCIFRNVSFCLCSMVLIFWTGYSAIDAWNPWTKQIINIAFTSLPVIFFVALDKQLPHHILLNNPLLYGTSPSTLWPLYSNKKIEYYTEKIKYCYHGLFKIFLFPFKCIPFFHKSTDQMKSWIGKRSKPDKYRSYGTQYLFVYLLFAIWLASVETVIILHFSTGQAYSTIEENHSVDIDFNTFSQILYTHHVIAVNVVVVLMTNTWFVISHAVLWFEIIITFFFWFIISNTKFFLDIVGADELHGTFERAHSSANYYISIIISLYVSLLPLIVLMTYQFIKKPTMEQIVLEQLSLGKFEGLRKCEMKKLAYIDSLNSFNDFTHKGFAFAVEAKEAFWGLVQKAIYKIKMPLAKDDIVSFKCKRKT
ncbi:P-type ATPase, putative [Plasmodium malariae]|uniref:P-type ATPase, putative n=1 Tax=Plasmodium malariae TaxID=5858 RepID=A0A1C3KYF9_PLAMA|nr:P-type ATPase, putative [Plasmodium malariae]